MAKPFGVEMSEKPSSEFEVTMEVGSALLHVLPARGLTVARHEDENAPDTAPVSKSMTNTARDSLKVAEGSKPRPSP